MRKVLILALAAVCAVTMTACINKEAVLVGAETTTEQTEATTTAAEEETSAQTEEITTTEPEETTTKPEETTTEEPTATQTDQPATDDDRDSIKVVNGNVVVTSTDDETTTVITYVFGNSTLERIDMEVICKNEAVAKEAFDIITDPDSDEYSSYYTNVELDGNIIKGQLADDITALYEGIDRETLLTILGGESYEDDYSAETYRVTITAYSTTEKIKIINVLKNYLGISLAEAKSLVEAIPTVVASGLSEAEAEELEDLLEEAGAIAEAEEENDVDFPDGDDYFDDDDDDDDANARYTVILQSYGDRKVSVINAVKKYLETDLATAKELVESAPAIIATGLSEAEAEKLEDMIETAGGEADIEKY